MPSPRNNFWIIAGCMMAAIPFATMASGPREPQTGSMIPTPKVARMPDRPGMNPNDRARIVITEFGECAVARHSKVVAKLVEMKADDPEVYRALVSIADADCLSNADLRMSQSIMRGAIFTGLYRSRFGKSAPRQTMAVIDVSSEVRDIASPLSRSHIALRDFSDCVVRANPGASHALVVATPTGSAEKAAFASLSPHFSACLMAGSSVEFSKLTLTGLIAEALFRLAIAPPTSQVASAG